MTGKLSKDKRKAIGIRIKPKEGLWINYRLKLMGITHQNLADRLGVRRDTVTQIIRGIRHSTRIEDAICQTLGYSTFADMIEASRRGLAS